MATDSEVRVRTGPLVLPTYVPEAPDRNPMFLEKRVYQGSSGKVYPLPFTDRICENRRNVAWKAVWLENEFLRVLILPEIGGRIHAIEDRTNGYDLVYRQPVIKPALVGLAGPWISGGIEFNWPQHHRPATFLPTSVAVEESADGSRTVWCGDHDPMARMKGMHGVCLHPGKAYVHLKVRVSNRTPFAQTFLWWANLAARVHEGYQSFFPEDVHFVADHARRAVSAYPLCRGVYYGIDYGRRARRGVPPGERPARFVPPHCRGPQRTGDPGSSPGESAARNAGPGTPEGVPDYAPNDLSFYANIPAPCSYMCTASKGDFCGGYDHVRKAGLVQIANHHIAPGKKQWTWGNHPFGYAWDRNLTEPDAKGEHAPYIELMAGVYTDNQPDFSFLQPGETRTWSQYWYPIQEIGPARCATLDAAVSLEVGREEIRIGTVVTSRFPRAAVRLEGKGAALQWDADLVPGKPLLIRCRQSRQRWNEKDCALRIVAADGRELLSFRPARGMAQESPPPATEPPAPGDVASADELYLVGVHLDQYRHATRCPTLYWREALRRDPGDTRCNQALGLWHLRRGEYRRAETHFRAAIGRWTRRNANPPDGEAYYHLGLCLRFQLDRHTPGRRAPKSMDPAAGDPSRLFEAAYAAFYKSTWNQAWQSAGHHALAELDCRRKDWLNSLDHLDRSLRCNVENSRARNLKAMVLRTLGRVREAEALLAETLAADPLDDWARHLAGQRPSCDSQTRLDIAHDLARAGLYAEAIAFLGSGIGVAGRTSRRAQGGREKVVNLRATQHPRDPLFPGEGSLGDPAPTAASLLPDRSWGTEPLLHYTMGWLHQQAGDWKRALQWFRSASGQCPDYCFPARLEEIAVLESAIAADPGDARAPYYLGNLLYDRRRHGEAIRLWERSARLDPSYAVVWRNLGIGYFNIARQPRKARAAYDRAFRANPSDARLLYERDQLWKRVRVAPERRLRELERRPDLVGRRDDLSVEICGLYSQLGQPQRALALLTNRKFQPWEGGEGQALGQYVRARLALGRAALSDGDASRAREHFEGALHPPENLGETHHVLANPGDILFWLGMALERLGRPRQAREQWKRAAAFTGDFQQMSVRRYSELTFYGALSRRRLGEREKAARLLRELLRHARDLRRRPARIDYFATSLPAMLLFEDDLQYRQETTALFLQAQARLGLGEKAAARRLLNEVLRRDPNHAPAADLAPGVSCRGER